MKTLKICTAVLVLLVVALAVWTYCREYIGEKDSAQRRASIIEAVRTGQPRVVVRDPELLQMLVGDPDCIANLESIQLEPYDLSDPRYEMLKELSNVRDVQCAYFRVTPQAVKFLADMPSIERVSFTKSWIAAESVTDLGKIDTLKEIQFTMMDLPAEAYKVLRADRPRLSIVLEASETTDSDSKRN